MKKQEREREREREKGRERKEERENTLNLMEIVKMFVRANFVRTFSTLFLSNQANFLYANSYSMHKQMRKISKSTNHRSLHNITSKLRKIVKNTISCHFSDFWPIWATYKFSTFYLDLLRNQQRGEGFPNAYGWLRGGGGGGGLAVDYVIKISILTLIPIWIFLFNSFPQWVFRTSFLIKQVNGFNKHALNSNKSKLYNIYTFKNIYIHQR